MEETSYPRDRCVHALFSDRAGKTPASVALVWRDRTVTYGELEADSNRMARFLIGQGVGPGRRVGVSLARTPDLIAALLGILKAGAAYVPLEPHLPSDRLGLMASDSDVCVVVADPASAALVPGFEAATVLLDPPRWRAEDGGPFPDPGVRAEDPVYVLYTSGSTGRPKGVLTPHRGVVRLVHGGFASVTPDDTVLFSSPLSFDACTYEIWAALLAGARLVVGPDPRDVGALLAHIRAHGVTVLSLSPTLFNHVANEAIDAVRGVKQFLVAGDVISPVHVRKAMAALPGAAILNAYGPTENTTYTTTYRVEPFEGHAPLPIGKPIAHTTVFILDDDLRPVPDGTEGELCTGGDGLAIGYLNRPERTAECFVHVAGRRLGLDGDDPVRLYRTGDVARRRPDGNIEFHGRRDRQLKLRGFRVEPGEIENALRLCPGVRDAVVVLQGGGSEPQRLVAYVEREETASGEGSWRPFLAARLPAYMVPAAFVGLDRLPLNNSGKVDLPALPEVPAAPAGRGPEDAGQDLQGRLLAIFRRILPSAQVQPESDFFSAGGDSLQFEELLLLVEEEFGKRLSAGDCLRQPSVSGLEVLLRGPRGKRTSTLEPIHPSGTRPPFFLGYGVGGEGHYAHQLVGEFPESQPVYTFSLPEEAGGAGFSWSIASLAGRCVEDLRAVQPHGPYRLGGFSFGGRLAFEIAQQLRTLGERVDFLAILDTTPCLLVEPTPSPKGDFGETVDRLWTAFFRYVPRTYRGPITLFRSDEWPEEAFLLPDLGWGAIGAEQVDVHPLSCGHEQVVKPPISDEVSKRLARCLEAAQGGGGPEALSERPGHELAEAPLATRALAARADPAQELGLYLSEIRSSTGQPAWVYENLGRLSRRLGRDAEAEAVMKDVLRQAPSDPRVGYVAHRFLATGHFGRGELASAERHLRAALSLFGGSWAVQQLLSWALERQGRFEEAAAPLTAAISLMPGAACLRVDLGRLLVRAGRDAEAEAAFRTGAAREPDFAPAFHELGLVLERRGDLDGAAAAAGNALALDPGNADYGASVARLAARAVT